MLFAVLSITFPENFEIRLEGGVKGWETKTHDYRALGSLRINGGFVV